MQQWRHAFQVPKMYFEDQNTWSFVFCMSIISIITPAGRKRWKTSKWKFQRRRNWGMWKLMRMCVLQFISNLPLFLYVYSKVWQVSTSPGNREPTSRAGILRGCFFLRITAPGQETKELDPAKRTVPLPAGACSAFERCSSGGRHFKCLKCILRIRIHGH